LTQSDCRPPNKRIERTPSATLIPAGRVSRSSAPRWADNSGVGRGTYTVYGSTNGGGAVSVRSLWSRILVGVGALGMLLGALDPLEGSVVILVGSALVLLGVFLGREGHQALLYWAATFLLITLGVAAMFVMSAFGGIGGTSGHSLWWGVLVLPYPVGWIMGIASLLRRLVRSVRHSRVAT
jgi:hypothetical protein